MGWSVIGKIGLTEAFPASAASFVGHSMSWHHQSYVGGPGLTGIVPQSDCSFAIYRASFAKDILSNLMEKGTPAKNELAGEATFSFVWFSFSPDEQSGTCNFVIGLNDEDWLSLAPQLRLAMIHREQFRLNAQGNLAWSSAQNELKRATPEEFELGKAVALSEVSIRFLNEEMLK